MTPEPLSAEEPERNGLSEGSRLAGVFFEPTKTFDDVAARPHFWTPLILFHLLSEDAFPPDVLRDQRHHYKPTEDSENQRRPKMRSRRDILKRFGRLEKDAGEPRGFAQAIALGF